MAKKATADDYSRELHRLKLQQLSVEKRVRSRFLELCKQNPDVVLYQSDTNPVIKKDVLAGWFCDSSPVRVVRLDINAMLKYIGVIENHLAKV